MNNKYFKPIDYKEVSKKIAYQGKRIRVEEIEYLNGEKKIFREHVKAGKASVILPITEDGKVIMIQEPRTPIETVILGLPAGTIEKGEQADKAAIRELEEETGYLAQSIEHLITYYPAVGYSDEKIEIYVAKNMKKTKQHLDPTEDIKVIELPMEEVIEMIDKGEFKTASTMIALMYYLRKNNK